LPLVAAPRDRTLAFVTLTTSRHRQPSVDQGLRHREATSCNRCFGQDLGSSDPKAREQAKPDRDRLGQTLLGYGYGASWLSRPWLVQPSPMPLWPMSKVGSQICSCVPPWLAKDGGCSHSNCLSLKFFRSGIRVSFSSRCVRVPININRKATRLRRAPNASHEPA